MVMAVTRRRVIETVAVGALLSGSGCLGGLGDDSGDRADPDALPAPHRGAQESDVVVRAWEDFSCPHCRTYNERVQSRLEENYLSKEAVRYEHRDYPIPVTEWSWPTAIAARSVQSHAGTEAFWTFAAAAFENQNSLGWPMIESLAEEAGADPDTVTDEAREEYWRPVVESDKAAGGDRGVEGTPTVFVDDYQVPFGGTWDEFYGNIAGAIDDRTDA